MITSVQNPTVKRLVALRRRRPARDEAGVVLVDGFAELQMATEAGMKPRAVYYCRELMARPDRELRLLGLLEQGGADVVELGRAAFERVAYRESPDGWLAVAPRVDVRLAKIQLGACPLVLVCEGVEKPGNLGAMLRTADAAGADAVVAIATMTDWGNPNIVRASKGALFTVPVAEAGRDETVAWLRTHGLRLVAATPTADHSMYAADLTTGVAIAVGAEHAGLTPELLAAADERVHIPMRGRADSLNVATTAAILLYEAVRQRATTPGA
jgi:TrmH family RNA methyltransferase